MEQVRACSPQQLAEQAFSFEDSRLPEMLFRYRARNYPQTLNEDEMAQWQDYRFQYLTDPEFDASICMEEFQQQIDMLFSEEGLSEDKKQVLKSLQEYGDELLG